MFLDRPLGQPEDLLVALPRSALLGFLEEEEIATLVALAVKPYRDATASLIEGDDICPRQFFQHLIR